MLYKSYVFLLEIQLSDRLKIWLIQLSSLNWNYCCRYLLEIHWVKSQLSDRLKILADPTLNFKIEQSVQIFIMFGLWEGIWVLKTFSKSVWEIVNYSGGRNEEPIARLSENFQETVAKMYILMSESSVRSPLHQSFLKRIWTLKTSFKRTV